MPAALLFVTRGMVISRVSQPLQGGRDVVSQEESEPCRRVVSNCLSGSGTGGLCESGPALSPSLSLGFIVHKRKVVVPPSLRAKLLAQHLAARRYS